MIRKSMVALCVATAVLWFGGAVFAHHGGAAYDMSQTSIKGTIVEFDFINPHCQLFVNVTDDKGNVTKWDGEFTNPGTLHRRGWTKEMFKPGDPITLIGNRAKSGAAVMRVLKLEMADGRTITALGGEE